MQLITIIYFNVFMIAMNSLFLFLKSYLDLLLLLLLLSELLVIILLILAHTSASKEFIFKSYIN